MNFFEMIGDAYRRLMNRQAPTVYLTAGEKRVIEDYAMGDNSKRAAAISVYYRYIEISSINSCIHIRFMAEASKPDDVRDPRIVNLYRMRLLRVLGTQYAEATLKAAQNFS